MVNIEANTHTNSEVGHLNKSREGRVGDVPCKAPIINKSQQDWLHVLMGRMVNTVHRHYTKSIPMGLGYGHNDHGTE